MPQQRRPQQKIPEQRRPQQRQTQQTQIKRRPQQIISYTCFGVGTLGSFLLLQAYFQKAEYAGAEAEEGGGE